MMGWPHGVLQPCGVRPSTWGRAGRWQKVVKVSALGSGVEVAMATRHGTLELK